VRIVTTSWDDGDKCDLKVAEFLHDRGLPGTFYVPIEPYSTRPALSHGDLRSMASAEFEIGAHGFSHKLLWGLPARELDQEVAPCKPILEDILGREVRMFCYPRGRYDSNAVRAMKEAGYWGARTVRMLATRLEFNPFEMPTTLQSAPHPKFTYAKNLARARKMEGLRVSAVHWRKLGNWVELGKSLFDSMLEQGGVWHLYGHSWEIEELGLWKDVEQILNYVCKRKGVTYLPNSELIKFLPTATIKAHENNNRS
jgi:peptidoglycan-N-acetylglucosamine deacetylase